MACVLVMHSTLIALLAFMKSAMHNYPPCTPPLSVNFATNQLITDTIIHLLRWMLNEVGKVISNHISTKGCTHGLGQREGHGE